MDGGPSATLVISLLWLAFAASHMGLASVRFRPRLVARLGERGYQGMFSLVALALSVPLVWTYFANKHELPLLWNVHPLGDAARAAVYALMVLAFVMMAAALSTPSPVALGGPAEVRPRGIQCLTRHGLFMGLTGCETLRGLRELSPVAVGAGIAPAILLRAFHRTLFGP